MAIKNNMRVKYRKFLNDLCKSGTANIPGAVPHLRKAFPHLNEAEARTVLAVWLQNSENHSEK